MKNRFLALAMTIFMLIAMLYGCTPAAPAQAPAVDTPAAEAPVAQAEPPQASVREDFVVTDMAGREVTIPGEIKSIATFGSVGVINAFVELMGSGDLLCSQMPASFTKSDKWKMQYEFAPQIKDAPLLVNSDGELLLEEILKLQPDLCITMTKETAEQLGDNGIACIYLEWKQNDDVKVAVNLMGEVLDKKDIAADYLAYFDAIVQEAADLTSTLADADKRTVLYGNVTKLSQPHIIAEWWIATAGGISVTSEGRTGSESLEYTQEDLLLWNPDVMLVTERAMIDELKNDALYSDVTAVKEGNIYYIPTVAHVWGNRTVEQPLTIFWTINKLYPDLVPDELLAEKISYFYSHFFKYDLSANQLDEIMDKAAN
ncbi:MAG: ABC transporter substrate-binding protein [Christensenellaceae bacterium]|jgi:iron complex transport system substrate-binding protein|nr:ABC transporter substrate-binding protein [Christensenellaceae bacterium]